MGAAQHALGSDHHPDGFGRQSVGRVGRGSDCHTARQPPHPVVRSERAADRAVASNEPAGSPPDGVVGGLDRGHQLVGVQSVLVRVRPPGARLGRLLATEGQLNSRGGKVILIP